MMRTPGSGDQRTVTVEPSTVRTPGWPSMTALSAVGFGNPLDLEVIWHGCDSEVGFGSSGSIRPCDAPHLCVVGVAFDDRDESNGDTAHDPSRLTRASSTHCRGRIQHDRLIEVEASKPHEADRATVVQLQVHEAGPREAPRDAIKVVFHSAVLAYVDEASRLDFAATMRSLVDNRSDVVWLSNEGPSVITGIEAADPIVEPPGNAQFHLGRDGTELIALTDPHGRWLRWMPPR